MASRDILTTDITSIAGDRNTRMPAWFEIAPRCSQPQDHTTELPVVQTDTDLSWLECDCDGGVEVIEHQVPAELLAVFFGKAAACGHAAVAAC
ncbi:MAG: hypothetical protein RLZZ584_3562 [Pseudomonadota bacterium]|jgi:hypothetical protein